VLKRHFRAHKFRDDRQVETVVAGRQITQETDCVEKSKDVVQSSKLKTQNLSSANFFCDRPSYIKACRLKLRPYCLLVTNGSCSHCCELHVAAIYGENGKRICRDGIVEMLAVLVVIAASVFGY